MRIVVDVMGGDHGPGIVIDGVKQALQAYPHIAEILLVGPHQDIKDALKRARCRDSRISIHHASEVITMEDKPLDAVRKKKDCSMIRAMELVRDGRAEAVISRGNTGALVASATFKLHRLDPVDPGRITIGRDGVIVERGGARGLLLPQVAPSYGWGAERLLAATCEKAGLPAAAWREPGTVVLTFQADIFGE